MERINSTPSLQQTSFSSETKKTNAQAKPKSQPQPKDQVSLGEDLVMPDPIKPHKKWLFINYLGADCNLTDYQLANIDQQELIGSDKNTHLVAYIDVGEQKHSYGNLKHCSAYYITKDDKLKELNSELIQDFGKVNMADHNTLTKYVVDAIGKYPADHVCLIMNSHGGGFTGIIADDSGKTGAMPIPQMREALENAQKITGKKLDIIGFDACLMAEAEVAYELKNTANIMLASEETENGPGWSYDQMLGGSGNNMLRNKGFVKAIKTVQDSSIYKINVGPAEFAKLVVDTNKQNSDDIPTFSAIDLTKMNDLKDSLNDFAKTVRASDDKKTVKNAINAAQSFGGGWAPYCDIRDLGHIADLIIDGSKDEKLKESAKSVKEQLETAVLHNAVNEKDYANSQGLSIFAPLDKSNIKKNYEALQFAQDTEWDEMLKELGIEKDPKYTINSIIIDNNFEYWPDGSVRN